MKPIIGVTVNNYFHSEPFVEDKLGFMGQEWHVVAHDYIRELELAGAVPMLIPIYRENKDVSRIIDVCDGILVTGGRNTDPRYYGEKFSPAISSVNPWRDEWEILLCQKLLKESTIPVLGICRGIQILNVSAGGTLYRDVVEGGKDYHASCFKMPAFQPSHTVHLEKDSRIYQIFNEEEIETNSFHTMGVKDVGAGLKVAGRTSDGLVEVIEQDKKDRFFIAMQFHPEMMAPRFTKFRKIFTSFVDASAQYAQTK